MAPGIFYFPITPVGNAVLGIPTAKGGKTIHSAGAVLTHRTRRNAGDGVPYVFSTIRKRSKP